MADRHKNFAYSTVTGTTSANSANPGTTGLSLTIGSSQGIIFPDVPFNATVWPSGSQPLSSNAEIVRVIERLGDTFTLLDVNGNGTGNREPQEGSSSRNIIVGDQFAATVTAKTLTDAEGALSTYAPYVLASGAASGLQTIGANYTSVTGTNSIYVFPVTIAQSLQFNQIVLANSYSLVSTSVAAASHTYYSRFGIYSINGNTLSLISSNSFNISETFNSRSVTWNYPTSTDTAGYGYGNTPNVLSTTGPMSSYISGIRSIGLHFGGNLTVSGGVYWIGLLSLRSNGDTRSTHGLSNAGIVGHIIQNINQVGTVSGLVPLGIANSQWSNNTSHVTGWWGRHIVGFVTATSITNFLGTAVPSAITLSALGAHAANSTGTILPNVTFVST